MEKLNSDLISDSERGDLDSVSRLLVQGIDPNVLVGGHSPIEMATTNGHVNVVQMLAINGANIETRDAFRSTLLMIASEKGHELVVKLLIELGANLETQDEEGCTALLLGSYEGHLAVVQTLIEAGASIHSRTDYEWTSLMHASEQGHESVVKFLIEAGANVNDKTCHGMTALICVIDNIRNIETESRISIIQMLIRAGADVSVIDYKGKSLFDYAPEEYRDNIRELIEYELSNGYQGRQLK